MERRSILNYKERTPHLFLSIFLLSFGFMHAAQHHITTENTSIQSIFNRALPGDTVIVHSGVYKQGGLKISKKLTLIGQEGAIIDGKDKGGILLVTADSVTITGMAFNNTTVSYIHDNAAIKVDKANYCTIENNIFTNNFFAIYLASSAYTKVLNNKITAAFKRESASGNGIHLWYCKEITVEGNTVIGQRDGIYFEFVENSKVINNYSEKNLRYGLHFMFSDHCLYTNNKFVNNGAGVAVMYTHWVEMYDNLFLDNWGSAAYGLLLKEITDSKVMRNQFVNNSRGIHSESSNRIEIKNNTFTRNGWALKIMGSCLDNVISQNNFLANTFDVATNSKQNFNTFDNNYWDRYKGYDLNNDGIGDVPHRPVSLFSYLVEQNSPSLLLIRSFFVEVLNIAESIMPALTPKTLVDSRPAIKIIK